MTIRTSEQRTPPRRFFGSHRTKWNHRPRQTPLQTADPDMIPGMIRPRLDRSLRRRGFHTHPRNRPTRGGFDEQASTVPGSLGKTDGHVSVWPSGCMTMIRFRFGAARAGRPRIVANVSDVCSLARYGPRERLAARYAAPDNSRQNCVYSRILGEVLADFAESTTNCYNQPPAVCLAR
jgi:hypothetical protein